MQSRTKIQKIYLQDTNVQPWIIQVSDIAKAFLFIHPIVLVFWDFWGTANTTIRIGLYKL